MSVSILGIGTTIPRNFVDQTNAVHMVLNLINRDVKEGWHLEEIYLNAGISKRHSVLLEGPGGYSTVQSFFPKLDPSLDLNGRHGTAQTRGWIDIIKKQSLWLWMPADRRCRADIDPSKIDHLVTVSCTGFVAPGVDCSLIDELGLSAGVSRTQVGFMGCHGAFNALAIARAQSFGASINSIGLCGRALQHPFRLRLGSRSRTGELSVLGRCRCRRGTP